MDFYSQEGIVQHERGHMQKAPLKVKRILEITKFQDNDTILDIGSARGELLYPLPSKLSIGIDISSHILKKAKKSEKISYVAADAENLPFKNGSFSKIICIDILEHLIKPKSALIQVRRDIQKNGELIVQVPTIGFIASLVTSNFHEGHLRYYSKSEVIKELNETGFNIEKIRLYNSVPLGLHLLKFKRIFYVLSILVNLLPNRYYPGFGSIFIKAKRCFNKAN